VVIVGAPYDRGTDPHRSGCVEAPSTLRKLSLPEENAIANGVLYDLGKRRVIIDGRAVSDLGDLRFRPQQRDEAYLDFVADAIAVLVREGKRSLLLGGDHLVSLAALRGFHRAGRRVQVVQLDAHHDYGRTSPTELPTHATFVSSVAEEGLAARVLQIGVRGLAWGEPEAPPGVRSIELAALRDHLEPDCDVYLTIDTDAFDPTFAPAVGYPEPGGLSLSAVDHVLTTVAAAGLPVVGADWTEYNPRFEGPTFLTGRAILRGLAMLLPALAGPVASSGPPRPLSGGSP